jgi:predicted transcriptional regulator
MYVDFRELNKQAMKVDYLSLNARYEASGLNQSAFAKQEGLSPTMLSYYLRKARASTELTEPFSSSSFQEVLVKSSGKSQITITTQSGVKIEIPF